MEYVIVCTIPGQPIIIGDEILVSIDSPSGRNFETYTIGRQSDGSEWYYGARGIHPEDDSIFTMDEFYKIPGIRLEGVVVAVYQDKQRRRAIEASDLWPKTTQNALT